MTCFRASLNVALEWYITFLTKQWCKALKGGHGISEKEGPETTASLSLIPSYISRKSVKFSKVSSKNINEVSLK